MQRLLIFLSTMAIMVAACAPMALQPPTPTATPMPPTATPTPVPAELTPAQEAALNALAEALGVSVDQLTLTTTEAVEWSDGCLGAGQPDMLCMQVIVPGFRVTAEYKGKAYEVRTNHDGTTVAMGAPLSQAWAATQLAMQQLINKLGEAAEFKLVSIEARDWPDSCLGISSPNVRCAQAITPGYRLVWESNGKTYTYHANAEGTAIAEAVAILKWDRQGGIAGFCDFLTVTSNGEALYGTCGQPEKQAELTKAEVAQLRQWGEAFTGLVIDRSDPEGVSDRMTVVVQMSGLGAEQPTEADQQAILDWVQAVYTRLIAVQ